MSGRSEARDHSEPRAVHIETGFQRNAEGSVLYRAGGTVVLATVSIDDSLPKWMSDEKRGWLTAATWSRRAAVAPIFCSASAVAMYPAVTDAVRVPPSASSTSQSMATVRGPSAFMSSAARRLRPTKR